MKRLLKPWVLALLAALCLHAMVFTWLKDRHWGIITPASTERSHLEVSLLTDTPRSELVEKPASAPHTADVKSADASATQAQAPKATTENNAADTLPQPDRTGPETQPSEEASAPSSNTPEPQAFQVLPKANLSNLMKLTEPNTSPDVLNLVEDSVNWKQNSLLDIGDVKMDRPKVDSSKDPFSPKFRQAIRQAKQVQDEYNKGIIEHANYPITEDADGTRYVNIKGVCWKLPEEGAGGEWQIVLSGCSGQKDTFRFELNITTDILRSDMFQGLPFGGQE